MLVLGPRVLNQLSLSAKGKYTLTSRLPQAGFIPHRLSRWSKSQCDRLSPAMRDISDSPIGDPRAPQSADY